MVDMHRAPPTPPEWRPIVNHCFTPPTTPLLHLRGFLAVLPLQIALALIPRELRGLGFRLWDGRGEGRHRCSWWGHVAQCCWPCVRNRTTPPPRQTTCHSVSFCSM